MQVQFDDALDELNTQAPTGEAAIDDTDALDEMFGQSPENTDPLETPTEGAPAPATEGVEQGTESADEGTPAAGAGDGEGTPETTEEGTEAANGEADTPAEEVEEVVDDVMKVIEDITKELDTKSEEQKSIVENSGLSEEEKTRMLDSMKEKDDIIFELQSRLQTSEDKLKGVISENQNYRMDGAVNQRFLDKFENDSDVQQFVNLKIKADAGDEKAQSKMEEFLKSQLSNLGYDIDALVRQRKIDEKKALGGGRVSSGGAEYNNDNSVDDSDALDNLSVD